MACQRGTKQIPKIRGLPNKTSFKQHKGFIEKPKFICKKCGKMFSQKSVFSLHARSHRIDKLYRCGHESCTKTFLFKTSMYGHVMGHVSTLTCQTCDKRFKAPWQLEKHLLSHMENIDVHRCLYCDRIFTKPDNFEQHLQFHIKLKLKNMKKDNCQSKGDLIDDIDNVGQSQNNMDQPTTSFFIQDSVGQYTHNTEDSDSAESIMEDSAKQELLEDSPSVYYTKNGSGSATNPNDFSFDTEAGCSTKDWPSISNFNCVLCKMSFDNVPAFIMHVYNHKPSTEISQQAIHTDFKPVKRNKPTIYVCRCCDKKFATEFFVRDHLMHFVQNETDKLHKEFTEEIMEMNDIDQQRAILKYIYFISIKNLKSCDNDNSNEKKLLYHCSICNTHFKESCSLFAHIADCKKIEAKYSCPECCINFESNKILKEHIKMDHKQHSSEDLQDLGVGSVDQMAEDQMKTEKMSCIKCVKTFDTFKEFEEHKKLHIGKVQPLDGVELFCAHCHKSYDTPADLYRHMLTHKTKSPIKTSLYADQMSHDQASNSWVCLVCSKSYSTKCNLTRHLTLHDEGAKGEFHCPFCNRVFQFQRYLQHHIRNTHKSEDEKTIKCTECEAVLKSIHSFKRHMKLHTGEAELNKKFPCKYCGKRFSCQEQLNMHERTHTGSKPFACDLCPYRAAVYCNLKKHINRIHENPIERKKPGRKKSKFYDVE